MLSEKERDELATTLRAQRRALFESVASDERTLEFIAEDRESELEERAQEERAACLAARLDDRGKLEIEEIDAALRRLTAERYGACARCGEPIPLARLRAVPATLHCIDCVRAREETVTEAEAEAPARRATSLPADIDLLTDRELEAGLREQIRADGRIDVDELRLACVNGTVHLSGVLPSERQHQELLKLLTDVNGLAEIDDRLMVNELLWSREDRARAPEPAPEVLAEISPRVAQLYELAPATTTEDIAESTEDEVEYEPPLTPTADEE